MIDPEDIYRKIDQNVKQYGFMVQGVFGDHDNPSFAYTIGLKKYGYELICIGLPMQIAHVIFTEIANSFKLGKTIQLDVPDSRWANMPVMFKKCDPKKVGEYGNMAFLYHQTEDVPFVQMIMCDREGHFPGDPDYDVVVMAPQTLLT